MSSCVITGCAFVLDDLCVWGDLWECGNTWIFNACLTPMNKTEEDIGIPGEARWQRSLPPDVIKTITYVGKFAAPFERRGVIVAEKSLCQLNLAAREYIK